MCGDFGTDVLCKHCYIVQGIAKARLTPPPLRVPSGHVQAMRVRPALTTIRLKDTRTGQLHGIFKAVPCDHCVALTEILYNYVGESFEAFHSNSPLPDISHDHTATLRHM
jgi:hypothetical protein